MALYYTAPHASRRTRARRPRTVAVRVTDLGTDAAATLHVVEPLEVHAAVEVDVAPGDAPALPAPLSIVGRTRPPSGARPW